MEWRWDFTFEILPRMLWATGNTLLAAGVGYLIAVVMGLVFLLAQRTKFAAVNLVTREIVEFIRSTPLIVQLFFVYFVAPQFGIVLSAWTAAMLTIGLHFGTYLSEVYRGGLEAVPRGQWEACRHRPTLRRAGRHDCGAGEQEDLHVCAVVSRVESESTSTYRMDSRE